MKTRALLAILLAVFSFGCNKHEKRDDEAPPPKAEPQDKDNNHPHRGGKERGEEGDTWKDPKEGVANGVTYFEVVTGGARPEDKLPMVVAVHGRGGNPKEFIHVLRGIGVRARVVALRGLSPMGEGFEWWAHNEDLESDAAAKAIGEACDKVAGTIGALSKEKPTLGLPIITGFSQGGAMSYCIAARHPDVVSASLPMSGWLPPGLRNPGAAARPPVFAFHGTTDDRVPFADGKAAAAWLTSAGYKVEFKELPGQAHAVSNEEKTELHHDIADLVNAMK